ncbi:MAG: fibronectin type III domain-containing protein [Luteibaculaceae bacterium]
MLRINYQKLLAFFLLAIIGDLAQAATDKYRVMFREDPAFSMVIGWNQISGASAVVYYDTQDHGTNIAAYANSQTVDRTATYRGMNNHFVRLEGLSPNTKYYFVIADADGTSPRMWFETLPNNKFERLSIVAGGDSRNNLLPRQRANRLVAKLRPHLVMFGGDMINQDNNNEWIQWMNDWQLTIAPDGRMTPVLATRGNHEAGDQTIIDLFDIPTNNGAAYYAITIADNLLRIYTLNTEVNRAGAQHTWLQNDAETIGQEAVWRYAQYHRPIVPHQSSKNILVDALNSWANTFYTEKFQLIVECDAHTVKHTWPIKPSTEEGSQDGYTRDDENGTVYIGEGCWGAPLRDDNRLKNWTQSSGRFNSFHLIYVDYFKTDIRTIKVDNEESVGHLTDATRFELPTNLDVFSPIVDGAEKPLITIENKEASIPAVSFNNLLNGFIFEDPTNFPLEVTALDTILGLQTIQLYIDQILVQEFHFEDSQEETLTITLNLNQFKGYNIQIKAINTGGIETIVQRFASVAVGEITCQIATEMDVAYEIEDPVLNSFTTTVNPALINIGRLNNTNHTVGMRFEGYFLPNSAHIKDAYIEFVAAEGNTRIVDWFIKAETNIDAAPFRAGTSVGFGDLSSRNTTTEVISWRPTNWVAGETYRTVSLTNLIEELRNSDNFLESSPIAFIINTTGNGRRTSESLLSDPALAPKLIIEYDFNPVLPANVNFCEGEQFEISFENLNYTSFFWNTNQENNDPTFMATESGTVKLTVTNADGYQGWAYTEVTVNELPNVYLGEDLTLWDEEEYTLEAGTFTSYLWNTGAITPTITVTESGFYSVEVTNEFECAASAGINITFDTTIGVNTLENGTTFSIYPNPSSAVLNITAPNFNGLYQVVDITGRIVLQGNLNETISIDVNRIKAGTYSLILFNLDTKNQTVKKIVKQ